jgi:hypothetical protein
MDDWTKQAVPGPSAGGRGTAETSTAKNSARTAASDGASQRSSCQRMNFFDGSGILSVDTNL